MKKPILLVTHLLCAALGFASGVYLLPILTAPQGPSSTEVAAVMEAAAYSAEFKRDLAGSDFLHWGEGTVSITAHSIALEGKIAPGPDYRLYLSPEFVDTEAAFEALKPQMVEVSDVKTFENFLVPVPTGIDLSAYTTVVVWCEAFGEFITAAQYQ